MQHIYENWNYTKRINLDEPNENCEQSMYVERVTSTVYAVIFARDLFFANMQMHPKSRN